MLFLYLSSDNCPNALTPLLWRPHEEIAMHRHVVDRGFVVL
jgi:hypothetical protein